MRALPLAVCAASALACASPPPASRPDPGLQRELEEAVAGFHGAAGVYVLALGSGTAAGVRADETFPTASLIKLPILASVLERVERGKLDYTEYQVLRSSPMIYSDKDALAAMRDGARLPLGMLGALALTLSDNSAALWLQDVVGGGRKVNRWLGRRGFEVTRDNSRTPGREADKERLGWGQSTPREMAELVARASLGKLNGGAADEELLRLMSGSFFNQGALSEIPPTVAAFSKQGGVNDARGEVVLVNASRGPYVFCVLTKDLQDRRFDRDSEAFELIRRISRLLWTRFGDRPWEPADKKGRFWKSY